MTVHTQAGPRTAAPMWPRPLLTDGEWAVYTALWSFNFGDESEAFPTNQEVADRAWCERGTAGDAIKKFDRLGLIVRGPDSSSVYALTEVCPPELLERLVNMRETRNVDQALRRAARRKAKADARAVARGPEVAADAVPSAGVQE